MSDIDKLAEKYEAALEEHRADPDDAKKHKASVDAADKLATARREQREADIAAGTRGAGVGVVADEVARDDGMIGYRIEGGER